MPRARFGPEGGGRKGADAVGGATDRAGDQPAHWDPGRPAGAGGQAAERAVSGFFDPNRPGTGPA